VYDSRDINGFSLLLSVAAQTLLNYDDYFDFYARLDSEKSLDDDTKEEELIQNLPRSIYCDIVNTLNEKCAEYSILEIWKFDREVIERLTDQDIVDAINTVKKR
jgi:hypothetical protein